VNDPLLAVLDRSRALGFLGPGPVEDHLHHALAFARAVATPPARALDLGAGGGLPGLVLASRIWPGTSWTFLDAQQKRTEFLREVVTDLGLDDRVAVITERAEVLGRSPDHRGVYDLVVSRSFGPPAVTAECGAPLLRPGGRLVVLGANAAETAPMDVRRFYFGQYDLLGTTMGNVRDFAGLIGLLAEHRVPPPVIDRVFPLDEAARAHEHLETTRGFGKTVLEHS